MSHIGSALVAPIAIEGNDLEWRVFDGIGSPSLQLRHHKGRIYGEVILHDRPPALRWGHVSVGGIDSHGPDGRLCFPVNGLLAGWERLPEAVAAIEQGLARYFQDVEARKKNSEANQACLAASERTRVALAEIYLRMKARGGMNWAGPIAEAWTKPTAEEERP